MEAFGAQAPVPFELDACRSAVDELILQCSFRSNPVTNPAS